MGLTNHVFMDLALCIGCINTLNLTNDAYLLYGALDRTSHSSGFSLCHKSILSSAL